MSAGHCRASRQSSLGPRIVRGQKTFSDGMGRRKSLVVDGLLLNLKYMEQTRSSNFETVKHRLESIAYVHPC